MSYPSQPASPFNPAAPSFRLLLSLPASSPTLSSYSWSRYEEEIQKLKEENDKLKSAEKQIGQVGVAYVT